MTRTFGEWLLERRREARLSQDELAARAGVSKSYISTLERNAPHPTTGAPPQPTTETVDSLAEALGVPIPVARDAAFGTGSAVLTSPEDLPEEVSGHIRRYILAWNAASPEQRPRIHQILETLLQHIEASVHLDLSQPAPMEAKDKEKDSKG